MKLQVAEVLAILENYKNLGSKNCAFQGCYGSPEIYVLIQSVSPYTENCIGWLCKKCFSEPNSLWKFIKIDD